MRRFMGPKRLWGREGGPDEDWVRPHVLWLPQSYPQVMAYFGRLREIVERYPDVIAPIADEDLHMTVQKIEPITGDGTRVNDELLARAAVTVQRELAFLEPFDIEIGPARASGSAGIVEIWPETGPAALNRAVRAGLLAAGLDLPPEEEHFWPHMSCGYGKPRHDRSPGGVLGPVRVRDRQEHQARGPHPGHGVECVAGVGAPGRSAQHLHVHARARIASGPGRLSRPVSTGERLPPYGRAPAGRRPPLPIAS